METWITTGSYSNPQFWDTPNAETTAIPFVGASVVTKSGSAHSGSWCAKLENKSFIVATVPALMTLADFNVNISTFSFTMLGGIPYNQRPEKISGYYKFSPQGGDSCAMLALFYKHNPGGWQDTVGIAYFIDNNNVTQWTKFESYVDWSSADNPDTMNILIASTASFSATAGSVLYVDDLALDFSSGLSQPLFADVASLNYNSITGEIILESVAGQYGVMNIFNSNGALVYSADISCSGDHRLQLPVFTAGIYFARYQSDKEVLGLKFYR